MAERKICCDYAVNISKGMRPRYRCRMDENLTTRSKNKLFCPSEEIKQECARLWNESLNRVTISPPGPRAHIAEEVGHIWTDPVKLYEQIRDQNWEKG